MDGEAPRDSDDVGDAVVVEELVGEPDIDDVDVDSAVAVPLALGVELGVPVAEGVDDAVTLDEGVGVAGALALLLGLAPDERDDVGDAVRDEVSDLRRRWGHGGCRCRRHCGGWGRRGSRRRRARG
jgi:hypothetical protein